MQLVHQQPRACVGACSAQQCSRAHPRLMLTPLQPAACRELRAQPEARQHSRRGLSSVRACNGASHERKPRRWCLMISLVLLNRVRTR